ncbi:MAG: phage shock protein C [Planctomycetota bacterium]|jgi:phage shock protein C
MSEKNKIIFGVCNWVANKLNFDVTIIRIAFVLVTILGGAGILAYLALWVVKILEEKD